MNKKNCFSRLFDKILKSLREIERLTKIYDELVVDGYEEVKKLFAEVLKSLGWEVGGGEGGNKLTYIRKIL